MKKIITLLLFILTHYNSYSQRISIGTPNPNTLTSESISTIPISVNTRGGIYEVFVIEFGDLEFYTPSGQWYNYGLPSGYNAVVDNSSSPHKVTLTVTNATAMSQNFSISLKAPLKLCGNQNITINAKINNITVATQNITYQDKKTDGTVFVTSINVPQEYYQLNPLSNPNLDYYLTYGNIMKFTYSVNVTEAIKDLKTLRCFLELPACVSSSYIYMQDGYEKEIITNKTTANGLTTLSWDLPSDQLEMLNIYKFPRYIYFDVYIQLSCNSNCVNSKILQLKSKVTGIDKCDNSFESTNNLFSTEFTDGGLSLTNCNNPRTPYIYKKYYNNECPFECNKETFTASFNLDIPPGNKVNSNFSVTINIPSGFKLKYTYIPDYKISPNAYSPKNANCPISYEILVEGNTQWIPIGSTTVGLDFSDKKVKRVRYTFGCNIAPIVVRGISLTFVNDNYNGSAMNLEYTPAIDGVEKGTFIFIYPIQCPRLELWKSSYKFPDKNSNKDATKYLPNDIITYFLEITNPTSILHHKINIVDLLDSNLSYIGNFEYAYGNSGYTPANNNQIPVNFLNGGTILVEGQKITVSGLDLPACASNQKLTLKFDVKIKEGVLFNTKIYNTYTFTSNENTSEINSNMNYFSISEERSVLTILSAKCSNSETWKTKEINVRKGDNVYFKLTCKNTGTTSVNLAEFINFRPSIDDVFESKNTTNRGSTYDILYNCGEYGVYPNVSNKQIRFSNQINNIFNGNTYTNWGSCDSEQSRCLDVVFLDSGGYKLLPGESVDVVYNTIIKGNKNQIAFNSFSVKASDYQNFPFQAIDSNILKIINDGLGCNPPPPCYDCTSFDLQKDSKYIVSAWVKEEDINKPDMQYKHYSNSYVSIAFTDVGSVTYGTPIKFYPTGNIIDGWQRIIGEFTVPTTVDDMKLELVNDNSDISKIAYFDDIRILPTNANMKSFVYDQKTQRLMAELDENNYSTFYEYDIEGGLIRVKKETERGVFTIQETRSGNVKK